MDRSRAQAFHDGNGIHALLDVGLHRGCHADGADDERDQAHQAEKRGGAAEALGDDGMGLAEVGDQGFGKCFFQAVANHSDARRVGLETKEEPFRGSASRHHETGAVQAGASHHHAWAYVEAAEHAVRLIGHLADDAKGLTAELNSVADL